MKKYLFAPVAILAFLMTNVSCSKASHTQEDKPVNPVNKNKTTSIRLATFNIRSNYGSDTQDWHTRLTSLDSLLRMYDFDIIGSQEPYQRQLNDLMKLQGKVYDYFVVNTRNSDAIAATHSNPIFYKKERFKLIKSGVFWYSETPDVPASVSWDASQARNCNWVELYDKHTGRSFFVFNSHFDHKSTTARNHSAQLLIDKVKAIAKDSLAICTGDFNTVQTTNAFATLSKSGVLMDSHAIAKKVVNDEYKTNQGYTVRPPAPGTGRIDHILVSVKSSPQTIRLWKCCIENFNGKWASDHYPVYIEFDLK